MAYDLLIKNGTVVDGSGGARFRADVAVDAGKIVAIGRVREGADRVIDAEGKVVTPGFVDGHTHMDAQVFWDRIGACSAYHGVTTAVMGNCGFTLAPCKKEEADFVFRNLERAEDIAREAMLAGIDWTWETFPQFLDAVEGQPKGINYAAYIGHSALRTYTMGERAFSEAATEADLERMCAVVTEAVQAGAIGFSTSRFAQHLTSDNRVVASAIAEWEEVRRIVCAVGATGKGVFEIANEYIQPESAEPYLEQLKSLAVESGVPQTWGMMSVRAHPNEWRRYFGLIEDAAAAGGRIVAQTHVRELATMLSFESQTPFDKWEVWADVRALPLEEQKAKLRDPEIRAKLVEVASREYTGPKLTMAEAQPPDWNWVFPMDDMEYDKRPMAELAAEKGVHPVELMIDMALERDFHMFFRQILANEDLDAALEMMTHPRSVVTFSDSGAHVSQIADSSLQTHLLRYWVRERQALTLEEAVRMITFDTASMWGFDDRGLIRRGMAADLLVFDPDTIGPAYPDVVHDLPAGAKRLKQTAVGMQHVIVNGEIVLTDNESTGATPGQLLRT